MSPSENTARNLRDIEVLDTAGEPVQLGDFWREQPAAVVFIRHYG